MQQMFPCPFCGVHNNIGQKFCGGCGQKLDYNCPYCGAIVDPTMMSCPNCFTALNWPSPPPTQPPVQPPMQMQQPPPFQESGPYYQQQFPPYRHGGQAPRRKKPFPYGLLAIIMVIILLSVGGTLYALDMLPFITSSDSSTTSSSDNTTSDDTTGVADTTEPDISSISTSATSSTATISWTTDEPATGQVEYGTTADYGMFSDKNGNLVTSHSIELTGLDASTTYHFKVISEDADENEAASSDQQFTTLAGADNAPPEITGLSDNSTATAATIQWTTNEPATSQVQYGLTESYGTSSTPDSQLVTSHSVTLTSLQASEKYYYKVISKDAAGNEATTTASFNTLAADDTTPPSITFVEAVPLEVTSVNATASVQITWGTDEKSTSQVEYGITTTYGDLTSVTNTPAASNGTLMHTVTVTGLEQGIIYNYRVISVDASGNEAISSNRSFTADIFDSS